jgi:adenine phosphoribosyltransferase
MSEIVPLTHLQTGGSAAAAGSLVQKLGGSLIGYVFILELDFLKGRDKLNAPVYTLLSSQEGK